MSFHTLSDDLRQGRALVESAERVLVVTGAGISTDSGIADFRGPNGLWTKNPEAEKQSQLRYYVGDPEVRKRSWKYRVETFGTERHPNAGHLAIVELERQGKLRMLVTQNVDGLHLKAGTSLDRLIEIHGNTRDVRCLTCDDSAPIEKALDRVRAGEEDPPCRTCGGILKTATISFGQGLRTEDIVRSEQAANDCDLVLAVGSTLSVYPAAGVVPIAKRRGAAVIIVNGEPTDMDELADVIIRDSISDVLPVLVGLRTGDADDG